MCVISKLPRLCVSAKCTVSRVLRIKNGNGAVKKIVKRLTWLIAIASVAAIGTLVVGIVYITHDLPKLDNIEDYRPPLASRVYDAQGNVIAEFFVEKRTLVPVKELPAHVRYAFIAAEDAD